MQQAVNIPGAPSTADLWLHHQDVDDAPVGLPVRRRISLICLYRRRLGLRWRPGAESMAACVNQVVLRSADPAYTASCLQHAFGLTPKRTASDLQPGVQVSRVEYVLAATVDPTSLHTLPFADDRLSMAGPLQMTFFKLNDIVLELIGPKVRLTRVALTQLCAFAAAAAARNNNGGVL